MERKGRARNRPMTFSDHDIGAQTQTGIFGREKRTLITPRNLLFVLFVIASVIGLWTPLQNLVSLSRQHDEYSHTVLIPLMSLALLYLERKKVFPETHYSFGLGSLVLVAGITLDCLG